VLTSAEFALVWLTREQLLGMIPAAFEAEAIYMGPLKGASSSDSPPSTEAFALDLGAAGVAEEKALGPDTHWRSGRDLLMSQASDDDVTIAGIALAMTDWHQTAKFDGRTGKSTMAVEGGAKRQVQGGSGKIYPRTDPVAIGLILSSDGQRCLLGRSHKYPPGMYTCLSGFVDQCESVEEALRREAFEEAGVRLTKIELVASQPWPIGRAGSCELMMGCRAVAESDSINVDPAELEDARWFSRSEVQQMLHRRHPAGLFVPPRYAIANLLITEFVESQAKSAPAKFDSVALIVSLGLGFFAGVAFASLRSRI